MGRREDLRKAVERGLKDLAEQQVAERFIGSPDTDEALKDIEGRGLKGIVRGVFGNACREIKSGDEYISICKVENFHTWVPKPVPEGYRLIMEKPVKKSWRPDLTGEGLSDLWIHVGSDLLEFHEGATQLSAEELNGMLLELYGVELPLIKVSGVMQIYAYKQHKTNPIMNGPHLGVFEWKDEPLKNPFNLINHCSDWDGTLRSRKATYALERYHPNSAGKIARIWLEEKRHPLVEIEDIEFPMFLESPELVGFVEANLPIDDAKWRNWYITRWDLTDSVADMWKLSPELQEAFPTVDEWFQGVNIGKGWQGLLRKVRTILDRNRLSGRNRSPGLGMMYALKLPQTIRTPEDIANFFAYVYQADYTSFHPDQDFNSILNTQGLPAFQPDEADTRNRLMLEAKAVAQNFNLDIYELMDWVIALIDEGGDPEVENSAPNWMKSLSEWWL